MTIEWRNESYLYGGAVWAAMHNEHHLTVYLFVFGVHYYNQKNPLHFHYKKNICKSTGKKEILTLCIHQLPTKHRQEFPIEKFP